MTQRGRIEAAQRGIRLNTDAIDNSAGVNTSDVEVNIKIALSAPVRSGALTVEKRNTFLAEMTDEVARLVLRNNYQQTLALSLAQRRGLEDLGFQQRLMQTLEQRSELDRTVEFLPDDMTWENGASGTPGSRGPSLRCCSPMPNCRFTASCSTARCQTIPTSGVNSTAIFRRKCRIAMTMRCMRTG
jgi:glutamate dehydrogenase